MTDELSERQETFCPFPISFTREQAARPTRAAPPNDFAVVARASCPLSRERPAPALRAGRMPTHQQATRPRYENRYDFLFAGAARFRVRQLAAAFPPASLLAGIPRRTFICSQQAGSCQSGSKLPHSKAAHRASLGRLELEIDGLGLFRADGHVLILACPKVMAGQASMV